MSDYDYDTLTWRGVRLEDCEKEDLIKAVKFLHQQLSGYVTPEAMLERALGRVQALKRKAQ